MNNLQIMYRFSENMRFDDKRVIKDNFDRLQWIMGNEQFNNELELEIYQPFISGQYCFYESNPDPDSGDFYIIVIWHETVQ